MYYLYFPYVAILAGLMFYECLEKSKPRWWSYVVLIAPITTPYFIFKSRKEAGFIPFVIFLATFTVVVASEIFFYGRSVEANKYANLSPVIRKMIGLSEQLKTSTTQLDNALVKLENLSKVESRINEIKKTILFIDKLRGMMKDNQNDIQNLVQYTIRYKQFFVKKDLAWVFDVQRFYNNRNVILHYRSLEKYLFSFEELLEYTYVNFYNITEVKSDEHLKNYDEYYLRYRRSVDSHNRFNVKRIDFQNAYLDKFPQIKPYLPGERQTDTFRLWE